MANHVGLSVNAPTTAGGNEVDRKSPARQQPPTQATRSVPPSSDENERGPARAPAGGSAGPQSPVQAAMTLPKARGAGPAPREQRSAIERAIVARLEAKHSRLRGVTWNVSAGNFLASNWLLHSPGPCPANEDPCVHHSEFLFKNVHDVITRAKHSVTLATFAAPDKKYAAVISASLKELSDGLPKDSPGIEVRVLIGRTEGANLHEMLKSITQGLPPDSRVKVSLGTYNGDPPSSWSAWRSYSHAKILSVDGEEAIVGGHNWWAVDYNVENPVADVSMRVRGPAARHAEAYFKALWDYTLESGRVVSKGSLRDGVSRTVPGAPKEEPSKGSDGGTRIISVGTLGGPLLDSDATSDDAIYAMIDAAKKTVRLSQQDLVSPNLGYEHIKPLSQHLSRELLDHLCSAMVERGVNVEIVLSTNDKNGYQHGWSLEKTRKAILDHAMRMSRRQPERREAIKKIIAERLQLRGLYDADRKTARNHAKVVIVDDSAFYIGSQNLYPGGMADRGGVLKEGKDVRVEAYTQLAEFGYIVPNRAKTVEFLRKYWGPLWDRSKE